MTSLGFENYAEALKIYLSKYREVCAPFLSVTRQITHCCQTQSTRAENQQRPTSSGGYPAGGPVGGASNSAGAAGSFGGDGPDASVGAGDQDAAGAYYGGLTSGHNGIGGDGY